VITANMRREYGGMKGKIEQMGDFTFSGNYVAGGEVPNWTNPAGTAGNPVVVQILGGRTDNRYQYNPDNGKILVRAAAGAEIAAAGYPAGVTGDKVQYLAYWNPFGVQ
jgi:hypothetical protein